MLQFLNLGYDLLSLVHRDGELAHLDQNVSEQLVDLLHDDVGAQKHVVLLGPLSDLGLLLIERLQAVDVDEVETSSLSFVVVHSATQDAHLHKAWGVP